MYELITGERPFSGIPKELLAAHLSQPVPYNPDIPILIRAVISKASDKLPHRRFQTATQMIESLELILEILESDPNPNTVVEAPSQFRPLVPITKSTFEGVISHLATANDKIYLCHSDRLVVLPNRSSLSKVIATEELTLDRSIESLKCSSTGCLIATTASLYFLSPNGILTTLTTI